MIKIAFCDDNEFQTEIMESLLQDYCASFSSKNLSLSFFPGGRELLDALSAGAHFDIYLLDLLMPGINGMEIAAALRQRGDNGIIIFITASTEYAIASYDVRAFYYMLKPVDRVRLFKVLDSAIAQLRPEEEELLIHGKDGNCAVSIGDVTYVDLINRVPHYHLADGREIPLPLLRGSFRELSAPLLNDRRFTACGASLVINMSFIDALDSDSVLLRDGSQLYPPKSAWSALKKSFSDFKNRK